MAKKANGELFGEVGGEERPQKLRWMEGRKCVEGMKKGCCGQKGGGGQDWQDGGKEEAG